MRLRRSGILKRVNSKERLTLPARIVVAVLAFLALTLVGCSAIQLYQGKSNATERAEAGAAAATVNPTLLALQTAGADMQATAQALSADATQVAATSAALDATPTADAFLLPASAETVVYGSVPVDSDRLNTIAALAFDAAGDLLVSTRAGEIYRLRDADGDGSADESRLIFADEAEALRQVAGMFWRGESIIVLNGGRLSRLDDSDGDGIYDRVTLLAEALPAEETALLASNGIVQAPDGRLFSANLNSGEILQIILSE